MTIFKKAATIILSLLMITNVFTGCKRQEVPEQDPVLTDAEFKDLASTAGAEFFEAFRTRNTTNMATLSRDELRTEFIDNIENYYEYVQNSVWIEEFYNMYLLDIQVVESTFNRIDDEHGETSYKIIIANYNSDQTGALVSYDVKLTFIGDAKAEAVYITNPELAIQLYEDMVDDYARYLLDMNYEALAETVPETTLEPTPEPTATPTPVPPPPTATPVPVETQAEE